MFLENGRICFKQLFWSQKMVGKQSFNLTNHNNHPELLKSETHFLAPMLDKMRTCKGVNTL